MSEQFFERSLFSFLLGLAILIISFLFYYPYFKNKKEKPVYGIKCNKNIDSLKEGIKIIIYSRIKAFLYLGVFLIILSIIFLILGVSK